MSFTQVAGKITTVVVKTTNKCKNAVASIQLPDRTKIFLSALWFWAYMIFYFTKLCNAGLGFCLYYTPDSIIIYNPIRQKSDADINTPTIIDAHMKTKNATHENVTNKLRALIRSKWDVDIGNDNCPFDNTDNNELFGGVNLGDIVSIYPTISTAVVWITYLFDTDKKLNTLSDEELGKKIKHMLINFGDKSICRTSTLNESEKIVVGEIPF
jgi:hypothetical protein